MYYICLNYILKDMKPKNQLLPHYFQKIGWGLFLFSFIFLFGFMYAFNTLKIFSQNNSHYVTMILYLILLFSALFVAFSKEKIEDELIQNLRYSSVVVTAYIGFLFYVLILLIYSFSLSSDSLSMTLYRNLKLVNPITLFMLYVLIFRAKLFIGKRGMKNEE